MSSKTHWKKLHNPDYLGAYAFQPGEEKIATINSVAVEKVQGSGGKADECMVVRFKGGELKPLVANVTNSKAIAKVAGSDYIEDWSGVAIQLYTTEVSAFGDTVQAVRVRTKAPVLKKPELTPEHSKWAGAVDAFVSGNTTIEAIKKHYELSAENEALLNALKAEVKNA